MSTLSSAWPLYRPVAPRQPKTSRSGTQCANQGSGRTAAAPRPAAWRGARAGPVEGAHDHSRERAGGKAPT